MELWKVCDELKVKVVVADEVGITIGYDAAALKPDMKATYEILNLSNSRGLK